MKITRPTLLLLAAATPSAAQVEPMASEAFDYTYPGLLINSSGGTGWDGAWDVDGNGNGIVIFANGQGHPPFADDGVGNFAGQANGWAGAFRTISQSGHAEMLDVNGMFGADGTTVWVGFLTRTYQNLGPYFGGLSLFEEFVGEKLFIGTPWDTDLWGVNDLNGGVSTIPGTDPELDSHVVVRIDYLAGNERVRMWVNPGMDHPETQPQVDVMVPDHRFNQIRFSSGGSGSQQYWDGVRIDKGVPGSGSIGSNYCGPANLNSTGIGAVISASGSLAAFSNNVTLHGTQLPPTQFAYFLNSQTQDFVFFPPGSQGILCLGGGIGRYSSSVLDTGLSGEADLSLDLTQTPTPGGHVGIQPGDTWHFQLWFRDKNPGPTSNFTDGITLQFL
ncbi:MAG: hypothetical protein O2816_03835 [Planctomycetota bacterium]|nr:hypothetical protein [Planctomycetota bacterium]